MKLQLGRSTRRSLRTLSGLAIAAGISVAPGWAQVEPAPAAPPGPPPAAPGAPLPEQGLTPPAGGMMGGWGGGAVAASGDSVYVVRGNIVYRLRASDLTELAHAALPLTAVAGAAGTSPPLITITPPSAPPEAAPPGGAPPVPETPAPPAGGAVVTPPGPGLGAAPPPSGMPGGMMAFEPQPVAIAAAGPNVYVLHGNILYQLRASDLTLLGTHALPSPGDAGLTAPGTPLTPPGATEQSRPRGRRGRRGFGSPAAPGTLVPPPSPGSAPTAPGF